ncbi:hypothetical protein AAHH86_00225 [Candidatus Hodgkinia cicadicola]
MFARRCDSKELAYFDYVLKPFDVPMWSSGLLEANCSKSWRCRSHAVGWRRWRVCVGFAVRIGADCFGGRRMV